ncbi:MAG: hypothetical protein OSJ45_04510 [Lachnospiraceae bacterium]|nr:hypothetical protein [Lachnospiraceae bacterium]
MKQKKKLIRRIAVFLVIAIIFGSIGNYNCKKAEATNNVPLPIDTGKKEADMWITTNKTNGKKDDIITLTFTYTGSKPICWLDTFVDFDNSLLEVYSYEPIDRLCSTLEYYDKGRLLMNTLNSEHYIYEGEQFLNMQFKCLKDIDKESLIKFTSIEFTFPGGTGYTFEEGYSVKLTPEYGLEITADKINNIKKGDIITFILTYKGKIPACQMDMDTYYDKNLFKLYNYEIINKSYQDLFWNTKIGRIFLWVAESINGNVVNENLLNNDEQFLKLQLECIKDVTQESLIWFATPLFVIPKPYIKEFDVIDYFNIFKLSLSGTSDEPAPSNPPLPTDSPAPSVSPVPSVPTGSAVVPDCRHLFNDYDYTSPVKGSPVILYGNGINKKIDGNVVNNKQFTAYTDILPSYNYTLNSKGVVKPSSGKVIAGITSSSTKPVVSKNKIVDREAAKIAKARIKNGQVTVTATGKEKGLVYLWIIDTGKNGAYECCPVNVLMAPKKLEVQNTSGSKIKNPSISAGGSLDICVAGIAPGGTTTDDCTYTATVADTSQSYVKVTPVQGKNGQFKITATGLKNNKDTKVAIIFTCNENKKKIKLTATIKK